MVTRRGFTLVEVLVGVAIVVLLASASIATFGVIRESSRRRGTLALTESLTAAIAAAGRRELSVTGGTAANPTFRTFAPLFDLNHDGLVDGAPAVAADATHDGGFDPLIAASPYQGALAELKLAVPDRRINDRRQPIDFWGRPLRIAFHPNSYGGRGFRVWSVGADGVDGTADDIPKDDG
jgi:prepilin-type N-terminal cleavage/methylation domain-containing protein